MITTMLHAIFRSITERIHVKWGAEIARLRAEFPDIGKDFQHLFWENEHGNYYVSNEYWRLPIVQVSSIKKSSLFEWDGYSEYVGCDGESGKVLLYNSLGKSSLNCTKYLASLAGKFPCVIYLDEGGVDELANHPSLINIL